MAAVTPDDRAVWVAVIGHPPAHRDPARPVRRRPDVHRRPGHRRRGAARDDRVLLPVRLAGLPRLRRRGPRLDHARPGHAQGGLFVFDPHRRDRPRVRPGRRARELRHRLQRGRLPGDRELVGRVRRGRRGRRGRVVRVDTATFALLDTRSSEGVDAHGVRITPDGREFWQVNRGTGDGLRIDARTFAVSGRSRPVTRPTSSTSPPTGASPTSRSAARTRSPATRTCRAGRSRRARHRRRDRCARDAASTRRR
jgi:DNA-binding beta-propeller fold protein YncE